MIEETIFGYLPDKAENGRKTVRLFRIKNRKQEYVELLEFGAAIHRICVRERSGRITDVIANAGTLDEMQGLCHEGVTIGRVANVIDGGAYEYRGKTVQLEVNERDGLLHSGSGNYAKKIFRGTVIHDNAVEFSYEDHGEGGFPGNVHVAVEYCFDDRSELRIRYRMTPEEDTPLCPTNHAFFHLGASDIRNLTLSICAQKIAQKNEYGIVKDGVRSVSGTPADFCVPGRIGDAMDRGDDGYFCRQFPAYNECYVIKREKSGVTDGKQEHVEIPMAAVLFNPENGIQLTVYTEFPAIILFNPVKIVHDENGIKPVYPAVCLEAQYMPNAVNCHTYESPFYRRGEALDKSTIYSFRAEKA